MLLRRIGDTRYVLQAALQVRGPRLITLRHWATDGFVGLGKRRLAASPYLKPDRQKPPFIPHILKSRHRYCPVCNVRI